MISDANFSCFYEIEAPKMTILTLTFVVNILNVLLLYGIVWFEHFGSDAKRMFRNRQVSASCWNAMIGVPVIHLLETVNYFGGHFSTSFCLFVSLVRNLIKTNGLLFLNSIIVSKYVSIFWLKNPASIEDDFWSLFVCIWSVGFSCIYNFVLGLLPRQVSLANFINYIL
jgi:hypothetical protein